MTERDLILRANALSLRDPKTGAFLLHDLTFDVARSERVAIVGSNGAGKTTTLRCLARLVENWTGEIELEGRSTREYSRRELARRVAVVAQVNVAPANCVGRRIVEFGRAPFLKPFESATAQDRRIVDEALERVGASRFADRDVASLSGGERQKLFLAAAFAQQPRLLLLDEPTAFLDRRSQEEISDAVDEWRRATGAAVLEATHDLNAAALRDDRALAIRSGRIVFVGDAALAAAPETLAVLDDFRATSTPHPVARVPMLLPNAPQEEKNVPRRATARDENAARSAPRNATAKLALFALFVLVAILVLPLLGRTCFSPDVWLRFPTDARPLRELDSIAVVFWGERLPKTALAAVAGAGLALAGLALQTLFRNPLATPYTLGVASGASFGATLAIHFSGALAGLGLSQTFLGAPNVVWGSGAGAFCATALVYALSHRARSQDRVLLAGVVVGFFFSSLTMCGQYLANPTKTHVALHWTTGSLDLCDSRNILLIGSAVALALCALASRRRDLDALLLGEERAASLGVEVARLRKALFLATSALVGVIVAFCGPIGFVGLAAPHAARLLVGTEHSKLIPASALGGALFLAACSFASRVALFPVQIPVGIVTSLLGGPFFLYLLLKRSNGIAEL